MKAKRIVSALLTLLMLASVLSCLPFTGYAADVRVITKTNPAITADVGETVDLAEVEIKGMSGSITWTLNGAKVDSFAASAKGVTALVASNGTESMNVYFVAKNIDETEYVLYENDFSGALADLTAEGWVFPNTTTVSVADGKLHLGSKGNGYARAILPSWLGDFGDYQITAYASETDVTDGDRWCSIVYRCENENGKYFPYYHMCVRANCTSTNAIEFAERTPSDGWNVIYKDGLVNVNMTNAYHTLTVKAYEERVEYLIDGESRLFVGDATAHTVGLVGLNCNYGIMHVDSIRVTVQTEKPSLPVVATKLINTSENRSETKIANYVSNQAYATPDTFDALIQAETHPVAILVDLVGKTASQADFAKYLTQCNENNCIPQFRLDSKEQINVLVAALDETKVQETLVASADPELVKYARNAKRTVIRGALDLSDSTQARLSASDLYAIYDKAVGAYAQSVILPYQLATKANVAELQEYELAVWAFGTEIDNDTKAAWLIASGANAVISDNWKQVDDTQASLFTANNSLTKTPVWTGHRGYPSKYPENSMSSYIGAYEAGADCVETDIHLSADNVLMVCHDETINRTTNGTGAIASMTCEQLQSYKLKNPNGSYSDEHMPTFEEMLRYFQDKSDVKILCELKSSQAKLPEEAAKMVKKYHMEDRVVFISFLPSQLTKIKNYMNTTTGYLLGAVSAVPAIDYTGTLNSYYTQQTYCLNNNSTIAINYGNLTSEFLRDANDRGMTLFTWTYANSASQMVCQMFLAGMNGMTTNDPQYLTNTVKTISAPEALYISPDGSAKLNVTALTYGRKTSSVSADILTLDNDGVIELGDDGTIIAKKDGVATILATYTAKLPNNTEYTLYTQPITVYVGELDNLTLQPGSSYSLDEEYLTGLVEGTTLETLLSQFANADALVVYDAKGNLLSASDAQVGTGCTIEYKGESISVILSGDVNGNGEVDALDFFVLKKGFLELLELTDLQRLAGDVNHSGDLDARDYLMVKRHYLGSLDIYQ